MFCSILVFHVRDMLSSRLISDSLCSRRLEVVGARKNGRARRRHARVEVFSLARARSLFRPLLPSACYAGYISDIYTLF